MSDMAGFFSQADRIAELEAEVADLKRRLHNTINAKSKLKVKYDLIKPSPTDLMEYRNRKATNMVIMKTDGEINKSLAVIARECGVTASAVRSMAYMYRQKLKVSIESTG